MCVQKTEEIRVERQRKDRGLPALKWDNKEEEGEAKRRDEEGGKSSKRDKDGSKKRKASKKRREESGSRKDVKTPMKRPDLQALNLVWVSSAQYWLWQHHIAPPHQRYLWIHTLSNVMDRKESGIHDNFR